MWKCFFILMQIKHIFTRKVVHLASFWNWGFLELGSGLLIFVIMSFNVVIVFASAVVLCLYLTTCSMSGFLKPNLSYLRSLAFHAGILRCPSRFPLQGPRRGRGWGGFSPPHFFARIKMNYTKNNLTKVTEWKIAMKTLIRKWPELLAIDRMKH